jgi:hypothetical protein
MGVPKEKSLNKELDDLLEGLDLPSDEEIRKETGYKKSSQSHKGQKRTETQKANMSAWQKGTHKEESHKQRIGDAMRGKTLEEMLGEERAAAGRKARSDATTKSHQSGARDGVGQTIAATRRANGTYDGRSMRGKEHKDSTKEIMRLKAQVRQDLKRKLGLGKSDSVPKDLLEKKYKKQGLL